MGDGAAEAEQLRRHGVQVDGVEVAVQQAVAPARVRAQLPRVNQGQGVQPRRVGLGGGGGGLGAGGGLDWLWGARGGALAAARGEDDGGGGTPGGSGGLGVAAAWVACVQAPGNVR